MPTTWVHDLLGRGRLRCEHPSHPELQGGELPEKPAYVDRALIADERLDPDILARFVPGDPIGPALHCMQNLINEHLHRRASPRLLWEQSRDGSASTSCRKA